ncbi:MAG: aminotransferase class V-fold PLP-dependent enzyme, partial [Clostridia bacterium]|nr:aminotransferase class V-fold PLP-dependent enzyme [Clostridia bacterium]
MIYFDNSATTWPKPDRVYRGVYEFMKKYGANPGRGGHYMAQKASYIVYECRELIANMLNIDDCSKIIFTKNTTEALNTVIKGVLRRGDHAVCTSMEHNSVLRPLDKMSKNGVKFDIVQGDESGYVNPEDIEAKITPYTRLVIVNHVSNVCGTIQDIKRIGEIAHKHGALMLVDGAQSGGILPIDMSCVDYLALAGHK